MQKRIIIAVAKETKGRGDVADAVHCAQAMKGTLSRNGYDVDILPVCKKDLRNPGKYFAAIQNRRPACIFNIFEGFSDNAFAEADFAALLESGGIAFTGNSAETLRLCLDKPKVRSVLARNNIAVAPGSYVKNLATMSQTRLRLPLFVKPAFEDASVGIDRDSLVRERKRIVPVIKKKLTQFPQGLLVEEFISGKEYAVALAGAYPYKILGVSVLDYAQHDGIDPFLTYRSKWRRRSKQYQVLTPHIYTSLTGRIARHMITIARRSGRACQCRGYFRVDIREQKGMFFVLDVNANPDINEEGGFVRLARSRGLSYYDVLSLLLSECNKATQ